MAGKDDEIKNSEDIGTEKRPNRWWPAAAGAVAGAVIVGAVWGIVQHQHPTNPVVASVGQTKISHTTFMNQLESQGGTQTLTTLIEDQLITDGAKAANVTASKQDISNALQNLEAQYGISGSSQLAQFLQSNGVTQAQLNSILKVQVLEGKLASKGVTVSNSEIQSYYNQNKSSFTPQGSKTPEPLSKVKSAIVAQIKQSKATPAAQLLAQLAKKDKITIYDSKYQSLKSTIENPPSASPSAPSTPPSTPSNATSPTNSTSPSNSSGQ